MHQRSGLLVGVLVAISLSGTQAFADKLCLQVTKNRRGDIVTKKAVAATCPRKYVELIDTATFVGPAGTSGAAGPAGTNGTNGTNGQDGALRVYGDGSDADVTFSADALYSTNGQYDDVTINAGVTITVLSGTVIRCKGTFTNNGTISVVPGVPGAHSRFAGNTSTLDLGRTVASPGSSSSAAGNGGFGTNGDDVLGGFRGGAILSPTMASFLLRTGSSDGGGGGGVGATGSAGRGGGNITILAQGALVNSATATIAAPGGPGDGEGSGGGAGGLIILGSGTLITQAGTISSNGGAGATGDTRSASGGGGGGGIVHLVAPVVNSTGTITLNGGSGGGPLVGGSISNTRRAGGGGGGGLGGNGGNGGTANADDSGTAGSSGSTGVSTTTLSDPLALVL